MRIHHLAWTIATFVFAGTFLPGCRNEDDAPRNEQFEGTIEKINLDRSEITLSFFNKKQQREMTITGRVVDNTEISINGKLVTIRELREGERVAGTARVEKQNGKQQIVAEKVIVTRSQAIRRETPATEESQPQSNPDENPS